MGLALSLCGCAGSGSIDVAGGLHEILDRGVHVTFLTIPIEQIVAPQPVMPRTIAR